MSDNTRIETFLVLAREDLTAADLIRAAVPRQAAFFLQQAVEKISKALLVAEGINPAQTHAIGQLAAELPEQHPCRERLVAISTV